MVEKADAPVSGERDPVSLEFTLSHQNVRASEPCTVWVMVRLVAGEMGRSADAAGGEKERLPLNLALVLDRSGSMGGRKLDHVQRAACFAVDQVGAGDRLALVTFDDQVEVRWPAQEVTHKDVLKQVIRSIDTGGSTNLSGGMLAGYEEVRKGLRQGQINRVLLLTDGLANCGITEPGRIVTRVREIAGEGVSVTTMGVGEGFNEDLLIAIAEASGGNFYFIGNPDIIPGVFGQEMQGLLSVLAQSIRVTVQGGAGAEVVGFIGYEPVPVQGGATVSLPDLYEHETKVLLAEVRLPALPAGEHEVCRLACEYMAVEGGLAKVTADASVRLRVDEEGEFTPDLEVLKHVHLFQGAVAKDRAVEAADRGDLDASQSIVQEQVAAFQVLCRAAPDDEILSKELESLSGLLAVMEERKSFDAMDRKSLRSSSYTTRHGRGTQP